mmetsp:Transcript_6923/g.15105  ORF Transcript_6923/g.15105 Transcript_6923/m.15105 type:complete len:179 (-) Transcript_6923:237-773(-)|eukprot:CAMPEP_0178574464 /NCGR_PEP_ID=MMETSP0697-20121206/19366_1 /TAXON_ID=265572 /ORGANISM="Extubocellulus spinifer, Strain CCMP396" /LENGTH=178 /DNA_ID=CAMNT_0020209453 /DNA_START=337 /DNA_END=873 /DNA_ORIENTATION=+
MPTRVSFNMANETTSTHRRTYFPPPTSSGTSAGTSREGGQSGRHVDGTGTARMAILHNEADHVRCSVGNRDFLVKTALDALRSTLMQEIQEDDWMYEDSAARAAAAAVAGGGGGMFGGDSTTGGAAASGSGVGDGGRGDAGGADRAATTALYLERLAEARCVAARGTSRATGPGTSHR